MGYLVAGLTVIYAISGIAVNHIDSWNPNYSIDREVLRYEAFEPGDRESTVARLLQELELEEPNDVFRSTPSRVQLLYDGWSVQADVEAGVARIERPRERPVLFDLNFLHLNHAKGLWTWVADVYAVLLLLLALTGPFVIRGKKGLTGRGKWWVSTGVAVPIAFLAFLRWFA